MSSDSPWCVSVIVSTLITIASMMSRSSAVERAARKQAIRAAESTGGGYCRCARWRSTLRCTSIQVFWLGLRKTEPSCVERSSAKLE